MKLVFFGDSIALGCWDVEGGWPERIKSEVNRRQIQDAEPFTDYNITYIRAVSGETTRGLRGRISRELRDIAGVDEHVTVVIASGFNDSIVEEGGNRVPEEETRENLEEILAEVEEVADEVVLVGFTPVDESRTDPLPDEPGCSYTNASVERYEDVVRTVARDKSVEFIPLFERLQGSDWEEKLWDGVHPNTDGHEAIYQLVEPGVMERVRLDLSRR